MIELATDEASRLAALAVYEILDTPAEPGFDDIVRIASQICGTPMALISLVDDRRQWFKAAIGLDVPETPREIAFCAHAITQDDVLTVPDATVDERFAANPLVTGETGLRFYAGAPLVTPDGHALGTLCVLDREPRVLSEDQRGALAALARQVMAQFELRRAVQRQAVEEKHRKMLLEELDHRTRNTLTLVQAIVSQSLRGVEGAGPAKEAINERLVAMAKAHSLLGRSDWKAAAIEDVVAVAVSGVTGASGQLTVDGPSFELAPRAALSLSMALHELATNAVKYGALSTPDGQVAVAWTPPAEADAPFRLDWRESGGPAVAATERRGFGSQLLTAVLPRELGGTGTLDYRPDGLHWRLVSTLEAAA